MKEQIQEFFFRTSAETFLEIFQAIRKFKFRNSDIFSRALLESFVGIAPKITSGITSRDQ